MIKNKFYSIIISAAFLVLAGFLHSESEPEKKKLSLECGDMNFSFTPENGVNLDVFGISFIKNSSLWIANTKWTHHYYGMELQKNLIETAKIEDFKEGKKVTLQHNIKDKKDCPFSGTQTFTFLPDNTFIINLDFELSDKGIDEDIICEWGVGSVSAIPLAGRTFTVFNDKQTTEGLIPPDVSFEEDKRKTIIASDFNKILLKSFLGDIQVDCPSYKEFIFFDHRKGQWAEKNKPVLWLGLYEKPVKAGEKYSLSVTFKFPEKASAISKPIEQKTVKADLMEIDKAQIPHRFYDFIIPTPKHIKFSDTRFPLNNQTKIYVGRNPNVHIHNAVNFLKNDLKNIYGISPQFIEDIPENSSNPAGCIIIGTGKDFQLPMDICKKNNPAMNENEEAYSIYSDDKIIAAAGNSDRGTFYSITTLLQMTGVSEEGVFIRGGEVSDYPSLRFRGIHHFTGKNAGDQIAKAIPALMSRFKINSFVFECQRIIWASHPEVASEKYGMTKEDAKKVVLSASENFIEIIPLIQTLSHSEWMFENGQHLDIAEDPDKPYAYLPLNPETYKMVFEVYTEAIDFFKPKTIHIGHDEVEFKNKLKDYNSDKQKVTKVIMEDTMILYNWLKERGIKTMLWSDFYLYPDMGLDACNAPTAEEAKTRRDLLPEDVVICDWHYEKHPPEKFLSLKVFKDAGFKAIGSAWFRPDNISSLAEGCKIYNAEGFLKTTWAGYNFKIDNNPNDWLQYWANILAGQYGWTAENTNSDDLPFHPKEVFMDLWFDRKPLLKAKKGFAIDMKNIANRKFADDDKKSGWVGLGADSDLSSFPQDKEYFGETFFKINKDENKNANNALMLYGTFNPKGKFPMKAEINIANENSGAEFSEMHFLITATTRTNDDKKIGGIVFNYSDGTSDTVDLLYGINIFAYNDLRLADNARVAWKGKSKNGKWAQVQDLTIKNKYPGKFLTSLTFESTGKESAPVILAITGVRE